MTSHDVIAILPMLITACFAVLLMLLAAFKPGKSVVSSLALLCFTAAIISIIYAYSAVPLVVGSLLLVDEYSLFFTGLILATAILIMLLSRAYIESHIKNSDVFYLLLIFTILGMEITISSAHFVSLVLGIEILSVSLYGLIGCTRDYRPSLEAAIKYLILAASASAFMLFGIALVYADTGAMGFLELTDILSQNGISSLSALGLVLILVLFAFKLAIAPFHMWSPDVYQGAPSPVAALIATGSKGALFAILLRMVLLWHLNDNATFTMIFTLLAVLTMFTGNLLALMQTNIKRLLAYSSIAHMGYLLIPLIAGGRMGASSIAFYLVSYFAAVISAFGVITVISSSRATGDVEQLEEYQGLAYRRSMLAAILALSMLSLTGIPPAAGFFAKFYIFSSAAQSGLWGLLIIGVINSGISAFYYLRVIMMIYTRRETEAEPLPITPPLGMTALGIVSAMILVFGLFPSPLISLAEVATAYLILK
ncbi:MAG: NADH-quinone oxidoreductase subunit N [Armatimonadota bacterium]